MNERNKENAYEYNTNGFLRSRDRIRLFFRNENGTERSQKTKCAAIFHKTSSGADKFGAYRISCIHSSILLYWLPSCFSSTDNSTSHLYPLPSLHLPVYPLEK